MAEFLVEVERPVVERISVRLRAPAGISRTALEKLALEVVLDLDAVDEGEWESFCRDVPDASEYQVCSAYREGVRYV